MSYSVHFNSIFHSKVDLRRLKSPFFTLETNYTLYWPYIVCTKILCLNSVHTIQDPCKL